MQRARAQASVQAWEQAQVLVLEPAPRQQTETTAAALAEVEEVAPSTAAPVKRWEGAKWTRARAATGARLPRTASTPTATRSARALFPLFPRG